ncbi:hypothetical protein ACRAWD_09110 [Caulobacter segnis]
MGQKVNPVGLRLGGTAPGTAVGSPTAPVRQDAHQDLAVRAALKKRLYQAGCLAHHHRASAQEVPHHDLCRSSGRHHRQEGR